MGLVPPQDPVPIGDLGRVHLAGIGGSGMSGVARVLLGDLLEIGYIRVRQPAPPAPKAPARPVDRSQDLALDGHAGAERLDRGCAGTRALQMENKSLGPTQDWLNMQRPAIVPLEKTREASNTRRAAPSHPACRCNRESCAR